MTNFPKFLFVSLAAVVMLLAACWLLIMVAGGLGAGFSDRTESQIAVFLVFGICVPFFLTLLFAGWAITNARRGRFGLASSWLVAAILPIPLLYVAWYGGGLYL